MELIVRPYCWVKVIVSPYSCLRFDWCGCIIIGFEWAKLEYYIYYILACPLHYRDFQTFQRKTFIDVGWT